MRPPRPVPATSAAPRFCSAIILRAAGSTAPGAAVDFAAADAFPGAGAGFAVEVAAGAAVGAGVAPATPAWAVACAPVSSTAMTSCAVTVEPSPRRISVSTPESGAGNSSTTLSVSMSTRFSSRLTASPAFLCQLTSVASVIDSGSTGTLTSISIFHPCSTDRCVRTRLSRRALVSSRWRPPSGTQCAVTISPDLSVSANASSTTAFCCSRCLDR